MRVGGCCADGVYPALEEVRTQAFRSARGEIAAEGTPSESGLSIWRERCESVTKESLWWKPETLEKTLATPDQARNSEPRCPYPYRSRDGRSDRAVPPACPSTADRANWLETHL